MQPETPGFDQRVTDLEAQIDRLTLTLQHWRDNQDHLQPIERRLSDLTERYSHVVGELETRLSGWNDVEARLQREAVFRLQEIERTIEHEWSALRHLHEEPVKQLREHAESLTEICVTTAGSAQTGIERAEARLATLETELHRRMDALSREVHTAIDELRHRTDTAALRASAAPWPLDEVTRLHQELREGGSTASLASAPAVVGAGADAGVNGQHTSLFSGGLETSLPHDSSRTTPRVLVYIAVAALVVLIAAVSLLAVKFSRQADAAAVLASQAQRDAERIAAAADQRIDAARQDAAQQVAQARETAVKAQVTSDVLAAPDLVRFNLTGGDRGVRAWAQLLWSRSRGVVFTASRMSPPPRGSTYQIWLMTTGAPVSAGTFVPDGNGRVTVATDTPPVIPRPVVGVRVTLESEPGQAAPSGTTVLARVE